MASPGPANQQPLTPPAEPSSSNNAQQSQSQPQSQSQSQQPSQPTTHQQPSHPIQINASATATPANNQPTPIPPTSLKDSGKSRRPRDIRLIHMLLSSLGVTSYQERVPLQLLDFAYRYTSGVLQDAVHLATEGYAGVTDSVTTSSKGGVGQTAEVNSVTLPALRLSIASRLHYQFQTGLPKEFLMDVAGERNRVALPGARRAFEDENAAQAKGAQGANQSLLVGGMRLPPERFCLTGTGWDMKEEWESEGEEEFSLVGEGEGEGRMGREREKVRMGTRTRMARWRMCLGRVGMSGGIKIKIRMAMAMAMEIAI
ncbi:TFIID-31kDa-domain-containing protein [Aspergillus campestris IBT 28561]|uniref:TFIID-31kDa-domain-containing protein n=1 Tax=Aspergillus campestris (strain IBT 28561) TaxID=1392248 RepID=A0A2I1DCM6_ASPC2|nr:TFIID-31kDa-domain-containing protein [Aspergillus campestris IBT 28561]PKY07624.1 TFIID-31kDa-domain-containing protein [Aspergillus campestris IBT 28561]